MVGFCISGTQEQERAQHGAWQVREVHWTSVLFSVPEIRSSGGRGGIGMEVPAAQHSGAVVQQVAGRIGVAKGKVVNATFLESLLEPGTESGKSKVGGGWWVVVGDVFL